MLNYIKIADIFRIIYIKKEKTSNVYTKIKFKMSTYFGIRKIGCKLQVMILKSILSGMVFIDDSSKRWKYAGKLATSAVAIFKTINHIKWFYLHRMYPFQNTRCLYFYFPFFIIVDLNFFYIRWLNIWWKTQKNHCACSVLRKM